MKQAQVCIPKLMRSPTAGSKTKSPVLPKSKSLVLSTKTKSPAVPKSKSPVPTKPKGQVPKPKSPIPNLPNMKCSVRVRKLPSPKGKVMLGSSIDEPIDTNVNPSKKSGKGKKNEVSFDALIESKMIENDRKRSKLIEEKVILGSSVDEEPIATNVNPSKKLGKGKKNDVSFDTLIESKMIENDRKRSKLVEESKMIENDRKRSKLVEEKVIVGSSVDTPIATN